MGGKEIKDLVDVIVNYIPLIYPGIISVFIFNFCNAVSSKDIKLFFLKAVCIGYLYDVLLHACHVDKMGNQLWYNAVLCVISICCPLILYKIVKSKTIGNILSELGINTSTIDNDFEEMCTGEKYNYLRIYDKNNPVIYEGCVRTFEKDNDRRQYIILTDYKIIHIDEKNYNEKIIREYSGDVNDRIIIYREDIRIMEKQSYNRIMKEQGNKDPKGF